MRFACREADCNKDFSTKFNRNKHEKVKKHYHQNERLLAEVPYDDKRKVFYCPTIGCTTTSTYKHNILKHLKSCFNVNLNKKHRADNKVCPYCNKEFTKKSNRDRHVKTVHDDLDDETNVSFSDNEEPVSMVLDDVSTVITPNRRSTSMLYFNEEPSTSTPSINHLEVVTPSDNEVTSLDHGNTPSLQEPTPPQQEIVPPYQLPTSSNQEVTSPQQEASTPHNQEVTPPSLQQVTPPRETESPTSSLAYLKSPVQAQMSFPVFTSKVSRLETVIRNINTQLDYTSKVNTCVITYIKKLLKDNRREAILYMDQCFESMLQDESFIKWLANQIDYRPYLLKKMFNNNKLNDGRTEVRKIDRQGIYDFWIANSIVSNDSANSTKRMFKDQFQENFKNILDENLREEEKEHKKSENVIMVVATKRIYVNSVRKLLQKYNSSRDQEEQVSLSAFYNLRPFYCLKPSEKEKRSCLCIYCLNPHIILKSINVFRTKNNLKPHDSLTTYLNEMSSGKTYEEMHENKQCNYYEYTRVVESYIGKNGNKIEYTRTTRVDLVEPLSTVVEKLRAMGDNYLKHRTYVDNVSSVFPILRDNYEGVFIDLDFSQNLNLRPKDEAQSAHFSGKQFTLHCSIVDPSPFRYNYHLSNDTKHDPTFVDFVLRDLIERNGIRNQDLWIQSDNAPSQYKNRFAFWFYQELAKEFNLRIIRTYGASGHGKGTIDAMSSFGAKNILRHDIVTKDIFFLNSESITDYLSAKKPEFNYVHIPADDVALKRFKDGKEDSLGIKDCMKQHLFVFQTNKDVLMKEYLCDCSFCLEFKFDRCPGTSNADQGEAEENYEFVEEDEVQTEDQVFDFVDIPSYATVLTGVNAEPLYFLKLKEKGVCADSISDSWGHAIFPGDKYFRGNYLKLVRSRNINSKKFDVVNRDVIITPDEINDTYVDINESMMLDINIYNTLLRKANF